MAPSPHFHNSVKIVIFYSSYDFDFQLIISGLSFAFFHCSWTRKIPEHNIDVFNSIQNDEGLLFKACISVNSSEYFKNSWLSEHKPEFMFTFRSLFCFINTKISTFHMCNTFLKMINCSPFLISLDRISSTFIDTICTKYIVQKTSVLMHHLCSLEIQVMCVENNKLD